MKAALLLLLVFTSLTMSMSLINNNEGNNWNLVVRFDVDGFNWIAEEFYSLDRNAIKVKYTSDHPQAPAMDFVYNFTSGNIMHYSNLTGECALYDGVQTNLTEYINDVLLNKTSYAGDRGRSLSVYEIKDAGEVGSRTWIHGKWTQVEGQTTFVPSTFQSFSGDDSNTSISGDFLDQIYHIDQSFAEDFDYPACRDVEVSKSDLDLSFGLFGSNFQSVTKMIKE
mmetsp:Transcript_11310/g.9993  ORF Transcript_11310/g.9993 Transcript_11310/m.9993 type:complete len:224 (+) Transcript_11310:11-682(+)